MIALRVVEPGAQSFIVRANEPVRIEVRVVDGRVLAFVYRGYEDDPEQDPVGAFDGTMGDWPSDAGDNRSWVSFPQE